LAYTEIRRDGILALCFVLYISTGVKSVPGWELQDAVYLTGTFSSVVVLVNYWTIAGLLSRSFETSVFNSIQTLVNVALSCPIWLATEHVFKFGPLDIGGSTLSIAVLTGCLSMSSAMVLGRAGRHVAMGISKAPTRLLECPITGVQAQAARCLGMIAGDCEELRYRVLQSGAFSTSLQVSLLVSL
jgi:hypothetical protein